MVLALLLIVALLVERFIPLPHPRREITGALLTVIALTYGLAATLRRLPPRFPRIPALFSQPAAVAPSCDFLRQSDLVSSPPVRRRFRIRSHHLRRRLFNVAAQFSARNRQRLLDLPSFFPALMVMGYTVALAAHFWITPTSSNSSPPAVSDPLTGLANYRHLLDVLENETERTNRAAVLSPCSSRSR